MRDTSGQPGLVGFVCPADGSNKPFEHCISSCPKRCMSFPLLMALANGSREVQPGVYHVTEILNPPQVVYYSRNFPYYSHPFSLIWAVFGSAFHALIESQHEFIRTLESEDYDVEKNFKADLGFATLSGTADLYDRKSKTLWDFKTIKSYAVKMMLQGDFSGNKYKDQMNIYRAYGFPEAEHLKIEAVVKDWSAAVQDKDRILPVEDIDVPIDLVSNTVAMTVARTQEHVTAQETGAPRLCTDEERWINTNPRSKNCGVALRCRDYCPVSAYCMQNKMDAHE